MASAGARAYIGGLGAEPPVGGQGGPSPPPEAESLLAFQRPIKAGKFTSFSETTWVIGGK